LETLTFRFSGGKGKNGPGFVLCWPGVEWVFVYTEDNLTGRQEGWGLQGPAPQHLLFREREERKGTLLGWRGTYLGERGKFPGAVRTRFKLVAENPGGEKLIFECSRTSSGGRKVCPWALTLEPPGRGAPVRPKTLL